MLSRSLNSVKLVFTTARTRTYTTSTLFNSNSNINNNFSINKFNNSNSNGNIQCQQVRGMRSHPQPHPEGLTRDKLIEKLVNNLMFHGKRDPAMRVWTEAALLLKTDIAENKDNIYPEGITPRDVLYEAVENCRPLVKVAKGGYDGSKMAPQAIPYFMQQKLAVKMFAKYIKLKKVKGKRSSEVLYNIIKQGFVREGPIYQQRQDLHKIADGARSTI